MTLRITVLGNSRNKLSHNLMNLILRSHQVHGLHHKCTINLPTQNSMPATLCTNCGLEIGDHQLNVKDVAGNNW